MSPTSRERLKISLGLALGFGIGAVCRMLGIPSPAPPVLAGAGLVVAMTVGYSVTDWWLGPSTAQHLVDCGGPSGALKSHAKKSLK